MTARLDAVELDAPRAFARWLEQHRAAAVDVLEHGTWLDREDIDAVLELPLPGVDELIALIEIDRLVTLERRAPYRLVVVDTAPTGHALRLLASPDAVAAVAEVLDAMQAEHRAIREQLARAVRPEAADRLIEEIAGQSARLATRLRDPRQTSFAWVTLPEPMSLAESEDALATIDRMGVPVREVVINRVLTDEGPCRICDRRRADEAVVIRRIRRTIGRGRTITMVPAEPREPKGVRALLRVGRSMSGPCRVHLGPVPGPSRAHAGSISGPKRVHLRFLRGAKLLFVGGKGGVGKTTVAAALALSLARADPRQRVLLLSADPAHSLGDVFGPITSRRDPPIGDAPARVPDGPANLFAREIDAVAALAARRRDLDEALSEIGSSVGTAAVGATAAGVVDLAPPGIDELFGLLSVFESRRDYDRIVIDTAPTGHALRLLELPDVARAWVQVLLRVMLKYRALVRPERVAAELVDVSKSIRELQTILHDRSQTVFVVVTRAAELPRRETERLIAQLTARSLAVPAVVVNALTLTPGTCRRCRRTRAAERREVEALRRAIGGRGIIRTPLAAPAPRGVGALDVWARTWLS